MALTHKNTCWFFQLALPKPSLYTNVESLLLLHNPVETKNSATKKINIQTDLEWNLWPNETKLIEKKYTFLIDFSEDSIAKRETSHIYGFSCRVLLANCSLLRRSLVPETPKIVHIWISTFWLEKHAERDKLLNWIDLGAFIDFSFSFIFVLIKSRSGCNRLRWCITYHAERRKDINTEVGREPREIGGGRLGVVKKSDNCICNCWCWMCDWMRASSVLFSAFVSLQEKLILVTTTMVTEDRKFGH